MRLNRDKFYLGIDPGARGAIALIKNKLEAVAIFDMPSTLEGITELFIDIPMLDAAFIEKQVPASGRRSTFTLAFHYGYLKAQLMFQEVPTYEVTAKAWQKKMLSKSADKSTKELAVEKCEQLASDLSLPLEFRGSQGGLRDGRADALLIAMLGLSDYAQESNVIPFPKSSTYISSNQ